MFQTIFRRARLPLLLGALASITLLALAGCAGGGGGTDDPDAGTVAPPALRTVAVERAPVTPSRPGPRVNARYVSGDLPRTPVEATVMTDEDCAPDRRGISRCLNEILLPSGATLFVRHPHDMRVVPCLAPGESVRVVDAAA